MKLHDLKTHPEPFRATRVGDKRHEIRVNDRDFRVGDQLRLRCWDPKTEAYTGEEQLAEVTYISCGPDWGLPLGLVVMSIVLLEAL